MTDPSASHANPLLDQRGLPRFGDIGAEHVVSGMRQLLTELETDLDALQWSAGPAEGVGAPSPSATIPSGYALIEAIERLTDRLDYSCGVVGHLMAVRNSPELRKAHDEVQPEVVRFRLRLGQSAPIYQALKRLHADSAQWQALTPAQRRIADALILDAELAGVGLEGDARDRFNAIQTELAELGSTFANHVLDATKAWSMTLTDPAEIDGLPASLLRLAAQGARAAGSPEATAETGPWRITLDGPSVIPFLTHSRRRDLREKVYKARVARAASGDLDNTPLIVRILKLRREEANLLGYRTYAEYSLARKMAPSVEAVYKLEEDLLAASLPAARADLQDLRALAAAENAPEADDIQHWDTAFWSERLRERRYAFTEEELRPYFPLPRVLEGLFALTRHVFGVTVRDAAGQAPTWHPDVRYFTLHDETGRQIAGFYLDPYSRPEDKRGGAWMDECVGRSRLLAPPGESVRLPVAYLNCNGTPPIDGKPSLMTFGEVDTLFHEFGHGLQHMLTTVDQGLASGIRNVEWDAVELPSQFMENWCYHQPTLIGLTAHVDTGAPLPAALFEKIAAARTHLAGSAMLGQIRYGLIDLELHHAYNPEAADQSPWEVERRVKARTSVLPPLPEDRFLCAFTHIFAGGYAAGYYSYKWAEVLAADAWGAFEEAGLDDRAAVAATGRRFRDTVLALGGSRHPMDVYRDFRGREPTVEALLKQYRLA